MIQQSLHKTMIVCHLTEILPSHFTGCVWKMKSTWSHFYTFYCICWQFVPKFRKIHIKTPRLWHDVELRISLYSGSGQSAPSGKGLDLYSVGAGVHNSVGPPVRLWILVAFLHVYIHIQTYLTLGKDRFLSNLHRVISNHSYPIIQCVFPGTGMSIKWPGDKYVRNDLTYIHAE